MHKINLQLTQEFEQHLERPLTKKEKSLIQWITERQIQMYENNLYLQLIKDFEQHLKRPLVEKEKFLIQWMAGRQRDIDNK